MKKIFALALLVIMLFSLSACGEFNQKKLVGTWETELSINDFITEDLGAEDMPDDVLNKLKELNFKMRITYKEDGTCDNYYEQKSFDKLWEDYINIIIDYYENGGLVEIYKQQGVDINSQQELEAFFETLGTDSDAVLNTTKDGLEKVVEVIKDGILSETKAESGYYKINKKSEKYSVEENVITIINDEDNKELMYFNTVDKNTMEITKMVVDYEEIDAKPTFKRVK